MTVNADNIPYELKFFKQWVVWRYEQREEGKKPTKVPYSPRTKYPVSVMEPTQWGSFDEALPLVGNGFDGIGFVLTQKDPYCIVDLDQARSPEEYDLVNKTFMELRSYTEVSPSGTGLHVVMKAETGRGRKKHPIEVYDRGRFITFTGNVHWALPIEYRQQEVEKLIASLPSEATVVGHHDGTAAPSGTDREVWDRAASAANGQKFKDLWNGDFTLHYSSQSEADFALVDIIAFYTQNAEQITRLFRQSGLGQRDKAQRADYIDRMILRSFDNIPPPVNIAHVQSLVANMLQQQQQPAAPIVNTQPAVQLPVTIQPPYAVAETPPVVQTVEYTQPVSLIEQINTATYGYAAPHPFSDLNNRYSSSEIEFPEGLVGEIAQYVYDSSPRPVGVISLASALGLMAGICGSAFNVSHTGLNLYIVVLAKTGTGKEALQSGISRLMDNVSAVVPSAKTFIGAGEFASAQGLMTYMQKTSKNFVSIIGECGMWLKTLSQPNAHERHSGLRRLFLDLYGKSAQRAQLNPTAYADSAKNSETIRQPAVSLLGESTQARFFECIDEQLISEGFVPRWIILEYEGARVPSNRNAGNVFPSSQLMDSLCNLCSFATQMIESLQTLHLTFTPEASQLEQDFDKFCDEQHSATNEDALHNLWSRAHMKVLKVAAIIAVGRNISKPVIDEYCVTYAIKLVLRDTYRMIRRYNSGDLASRVEASNSEQSAEILRALRAYGKMPEKSLRSYGVTPVMRDSFAVPYVYFQRKLAKKAAFTKDRRGSSIAIQKALDECAATGLLVSVPTTQAAQQFATNGKLWVVSDYAQLDPTELD